MCENIGMTIRSAGSSLPMTRLETTSAAESAVAQATRATPGTGTTGSDAFVGNGQQTAGRSAPALPAAAGFDYSQLTEAEQGDLADRAAAQQQGIELPASRDAIAAVFDDEGVARLVGRSVMTQGDVTDVLKELGLPAGETLGDPATKKSLAAVQQAFGLPITGDLDSETLLALLQAKASDDRRTPTQKKASPASLSEASRSQGGAGGAGGAGGSGGAGSTSNAGGSESPGALTPTQAANYNYAAGDITPEKLMKMSPGLSADKAAEIAPHLNQAMTEAGITTPGRQAAFIAQVAHESGNFKYSEEIASGRAYEGRRDLGNTQPGDGERFKGRGYIQLTGRSNYAAAGKALGLDLVNNPSLAARPENAARIAAWFWNSRGLNAKADAGDFNGITRSINGGYNGKADRDRRFEVALANVGTGNTNNVA